MFAKYKKLNKEGRELSHRLVEQLASTWSPAKRVTVRLCTLSLMLTITASKLEFLDIENYIEYMIIIFFGWIPGCYLFNVIVHPMAATRTDRFLVILCIPAQVSITIWFLYQY